METQSNFNPQPHKSFWQKYGRQTLLGLAGIVLAGLILLGTGGFERLAHIFGIGAATTQTIDLTGEGNLYGGSQAEDSHIDITTQATLEGVEIVLNQDKVPEGDKPGMIVPQARGDIVCIPEMDCFGGTPRYESAALDLSVGAENDTEYTLDTIRVSAFIPEGASMSFDYRTGATLADLQAASFQPLETDFSPEFSPSDAPTISLSSTTLSTSAQRYVQVGVSFESGFMIGPIGFDFLPAVYGWSIDYTSQTPPIDDGNDNDGDLPPADDDTGDDQPGDNGDTGDDEQPADSNLTRNIIVQYDTNQAPEAATVKLLAADPQIGMEIIGTDLELPATGELSFDIEIPAGAYAVLIESDTNRTGVGVLLIGGADEYEVEIGPMPDFMPLPSGLLSADLNQDGVVNGVDYNIFLDQWN